MAHATPPDWFRHLLKPKSGLFAQALRPADVLEALCDLCLTRRYLLEDVDYRKIAPNHFIIELSGANYQQNYRPLEQQFCQQGRARLLEHLTNANSRQGRPEYRFAGPVLVEVRPAPDLQADQVRILFRLESGIAPTAPRLLLPACLQTPDGSQRWQLQEGLVTLGRDAKNDVFLNMSGVQEKKLVSGQHAYLRCTRREYRLFDGTPRGQASTNGTFVNFRRVSAEGMLLQEGDVILLAALNPSAPNLETPGVAVLHFRAHCSS